LFQQVNTLSNIYSMLHAHYSLVKSTTVKSNIVLTKNFFVNVT